MTMKKGKKYGKRRLYRLFLGLGTALALFAMTPMSALADPATDAKKAEQDKKEQELKQAIAENQSQLNQLNTQVGALANEQAQVNSQISALNGQITELMTNIDILESDIQITENEIYETNLELEEAIKREDDQYEATMTRIRCMYEQGETNYVSLLVTASSFSEFLTNAEYIEKVYEYDQKLLNDYQETKKQVQQLKEDLIEQEEELQAAREDLLAQKSELDNRKNALRAIAADYESQIASARKQADIYAAKIKAQNAEVKAIEAERAALLKAEADKAKKDTVVVAQNTGITVPSSPTGGTAITTGNVVSAGPNARFHGAQYQIDTGVITSAAGSEKGKEVCMYAIQFLGNPYVHAGRSLITGTDCSGFTSLVYKHFGVNISPGSSYQSHEGRSVSYAEAEPGDVVVYPGHVALYLGNGKIIHASSSSSGIKISNVTYRQFTDIRRML